MKILAARHLWFSVALFSLFVVLIPGAIKAQEQVPVFTFPAEGEIPRFSGMVGESMNLQLTADHEPVEFLITGNFLPQGLTLNAVTGVISGTLEAPVGVRTTFIARNAAGDSLPARLDFSVIRPSQSLTTTLKIGSPRIVEGANWWVDPDATIAKLRQPLTFNGTLRTEGLERNAVNASGTGSITSRVVVTRFNNAFILARLASQGDLPQAQGYALFLDTFLGNQELRERIVAVKTNARLGGPLEKLVPTSLLALRVYNNHRGGLNYTDKYKNGDEISSVSSWQTPAQMMWMNWPGDLTLINLQGFGTLMSNLVLSAKSGLSSDYEARVGTFNFFGVNSGRFNVPPIIND